MHVCLVGHHLLLLVLVLDELHESQRNCSLKRHLPREYESPFMAGSGGRGEMLRRSAV